MAKVNYPSEADPSRSQVLRLRRVHLGGRLPPVLAIGRPHRGLHDAHCRSGTRDRKSPEAQKQAAEVLKALESNKLNYYYCRTSRIRGGGAMVTKVYEFLVRVGG